MRVTNRMMVNSHQRNLSKNLRKLNQVENQLVTKQLVNRPSDNPVNASRIMGLNNQIGRNEQLKSNMESAIDVTNATDTALGQVNDQLQRIRELTVQAANGDVKTDSDLEAIADEIDELTSAVMQFMNSTHGDQYIFGGSVTDKAPFELVDGQVVYNGNDEVTQVGLAQGITIGQNIPGSELLGGEPNIFETLSQLSDAIRNGDMEELDELMPDLDQHMQNINNNRSRVGVIQNRIEASITSTENNILNLTENLSRIQDVDFAEKSIELALLDATYSATLQIASQISRPTLVDYLR